MLFRSECRTPLSARGVPQIALPPGATSRRELGAALSPFYPKLNQHYDIQAGITFGAKKLLRLGIILYGSYITLGEIATLGLNGFLISLFIVAGVFIAAIFIGKMLKLDNEISLLVGIGSAVCGAAAILALESTLKTHPSKSSVALGFKIGRAHV